MSTPSDGVRIFLVQLDDDTRRVIKAVLGAHSEPERLIRAYIEDQASNRLPLSGPRPRIVSIEEIISDVAIDDATQRSKAQAFSRSPRPTHGNRSQKGKTTQHRRGSRRKPLPIRLRDMSHKITHALLQHVTGEVIWFVLVVVTAGFAAHGR